MSVLVTGATGLLGSHLVDLLVERGIAVRALAQPGEDTTRLEQSGVEIARGSLADRASLERAVAGMERVLHCAARTGPWGPEGEYEIANVQGLRALIEASLDAGVQRFVHVSSITVHGNDIHGVADERAPIREEPNPYSRTKVAGERLAQQMIRERGAPITIVRPGWIYGPRDMASFARFATLIAQGKMIVIGRGDNHIPLVYASDVARGILLASEAPATVGQAYLLVNDERVTQNDYFAAIAAELGVAPPARHLPYHLALALATVAEKVWGLRGSATPPPVMRYGLQLAGGENALVISKARRELGFEPQIAMKDGVRQSVAWLRAQRQAPVGREAFA